MGNDSKQDSKTTTQILTPEQQRLAALSAQNYEQFAGSNPKLPGSAGVAGFDPLQTAGQEQVLGSVGQAAGTVNSANASNQRFTGGEFLDPDNASTQGAIRAAVRPLTDTYRDITLPGIAADASTSGSGGISANFGGSRHGVAEGLATRDLNTKIGDVSSTIADRARTTGLDNMLRAIGQAPATAAASTIPGGITSTVGDIRQNLRQTQMSADQQAQQFADWLPAIKAQLLGQGAAGLPGGSTQSIGTTETSANPFSQVIGGAAAAGGLAGGLSKLLPLFMSDRRVKHNIIFLRTLPNGHKWYRFNYIGDSTPAYGVMADEVMERDPDAVVRTTRGFAVDYNRVLAA